MTRRESILERISKRSTLDPLTGCQVWQGPTSGKKGRGRGYPRMKLHDQTCAVHRVVATCHFGYIPSKIQVDHTCRNRLCVAIYHLELVTHKQNQRRRRKKK